MIFAREAYARGATQAPTTVLIVEDNEDNLFTLRADARADVASRSWPLPTAGRRSTIAARELPDLVIMDMQMPGMSGLQATGAIRALPGGADVPILALTAQAMTGDRERILERGLRRLPAEAGARRGSCARR